MSAVRLAVADALWVLNHSTPGSTRNSMPWLNSMSVSSVIFFSFTLLKFTVEKLVPLSISSCYLLSWSIYHKVSRRDTMTRKMVHTE